jgi:hypothetical protein
VRLAGRTHHVVFCCVVWVVLEGCASSPTPPPGPRPNPAIPNTRGTPHANVSTAMLHLPAIPRPRLPRQQNNVQIPVVDDKPPIVHVILVGCLQQHAWHADMCN